MENNHQEHRCNCGNQQEKQIDILSLLPFIATLLKPDTDTDKFKMLGRLEARLSILEDEVNSLKKLI